jgi:hypothetical protein
VLVLTVACKTAGWCRDVGVLKTVHLRHDAPGAWPGWRLEGVQVGVWEERTLKEIALHLLSSGAPIS